MHRTVIAGMAAGTLALAAPASAANPTQLVLPQSNAFSILGASCGGIQEQAFATGFDPASGDPTGDVHLQTRCGGSGRGGGYHSTTYSAWAGASWDFSGAVVTDARLAASPTVDAGFKAYDAHGDEVYNQANQAYLVVPAPAAPTGVTAALSGGQYHVSWVPDPGAAAQITSSTVTVTPATLGLPAIVATVSGPASSTPVGPLQPQTTYAVTVVSNDSAGSSPASAPVAITTGSSATTPGAPTGVGARWTAPGYPNDSLAASWQPGTPGDSPTDLYQITIAGSDGGGTFTQTVSGATLTASFVASDGSDWRITVRAHDAAGWGPWSARGSLGGI